MPFVLTALCVMTLAYRYYSAFIAARVLAIRDTGIKGTPDFHDTPAYQLSDGHNYVPTSKWVLFGHHFAAITGAGPLIGPVLAAQFGFLPGFLWLLIGVVLGGAVHDLVILVGSVRHEGKSLAALARITLGPWAGRLCGLAILFIIVVALAGLGIAVVNALQDSAWGTFTLATTVPVALIMGFYTHRIRPGRVGEATVFGIICLLLALIFGRDIAATAFGEYFKLSKNTLIICVAAYGFIASVLPVWMLLCPRDYLSSYMKLGTIAALTLAVLWVNPTLHMPMLSRFVDGGGPIVAGKLFPFVFITIACGAISGFHSLIASGTTPKMIENEKDCRAIGFGAMLCECWVGLTALIAASALYPEDYFAINVSAEKFHALQMAVVNLPTLSDQVGEVVAGRPGGAVSLAVGMAQIFSGLPGLKTLMSYWYHYAILFEALFILTTIDTGTRVARFLVQEFLGAIHEPWGKPDWVPGSLFSTGAVVFGWTAFIWTGSISTLWPLFGIANQLLASIALVVGTSLILEMNPKNPKRAWITILPLSFVGTTTITAGVESIFQTFLPLAGQGHPIMAYLDSFLVATMCLSLLVIVGIGLSHWIRGRSPVFQVETP